MTVLVWVVAVWLLSNVLFVALMVLRKRVIHPRPPMRRSSSAGQVWFPPAA